MYKLLVLFLLCISLTGCAERVDTSYEELVAVLVGKAVLISPDDNPTPGPTPNKKHLRKDCPNGGWIVHGDNHRTPCPDCIDSEGKKYWTDERLMKEAPEYWAATQKGESYIPKAPKVSLPKSVKESLEPCPDGKCPIKPKKEEPLPEINKDDYVTRQEVRDVIGEELMAIIEELDKIEADKKEQKEDKVVADPPAAAKPVIYGEWNGWLWKWEDDKWSPVKDVKATLVWAGDRWIKKGAYDAGRNYQPANHYLNNYHSDGGCSSGSCGGGGGGFGFFSGGCSSCR